MVNAINKIRHKDGGTLLRFRGGLTDELVFEMTPKWDEGSIHVDVASRSFAGVGWSECKQTPPGGHEPLH